MMPNLRKCKNLKGIATRLTLRPKNKKKVIATRLTLRPKNKKRIATRLTIRPKNEKKGIATRLTLRPKNIKERNSYQANPEAKKQKERDSYQANPEAKKQKKGIATRLTMRPKNEKKGIATRLTLRPRKNLKEPSIRKTAKSTMQKYYNNNRSHLLFRKFNAYYSTSGLSMRAAKLVLRAKKYMKTRAGGCSYSLHEPKQHTTELYVKIIKKAIPKKLISAFESSGNGSSVKVKASTLANAVQNIAVRKVLNKALKRRKESVGNFPGMCEEGY